MKIMCWNVRGCNKPFKQKEIKNFLLHHKVDVCALIETRVKVNQFPKAFAKIFKCWQAFHNHDHASNGRIWLAWNPKIVALKVFVAK